MADSSARNLGYEQPDQAKAKQTTIILNPGKVAWTKMEKFLVIAGTLITFCLMAMLVVTSTSATSAQEKLANEEKIVSSKQNSNADLKQEIGELSSSSNLNKVAKQQGLTLIESNIRNIR